MDLNKPIIKILAGVLVTLIGVVTIAFITWGIQEMSKPCIEKVDVFRGLSEENRRKLEPMKEPMEELENIASKIKIVNSLTSTEIEEIKVNIDAIKRDIINYLRSKRDKGLVIVDTKLATSILIDIGNRQQLINKILIKYTDNNNTLTDEDANTIYENINGIIESMFNIILI